MSHNFPKGGYLNKILRVNLTSKEIWQEQAKPSLLMEYIGGTGLGIRLLYEGAKKWSSEEERRDIIVIMTGPLTGTLVPGSGTYSVLCKNALTGFATASQANGFFGSRLKYAGYDGLIIEGKAEELVYISINNGDTKIEDASALAGMGTSATDSVLREIHGEKGYDSKVSVACIGPAGENRVRFACLGNDRGHIAGSGGVGSILGTKKVKAIVVQGTIGIPVPERSVNQFFSNIMKWRHEAKNTGIGKIINESGSIGLFSDFHSKGWVPVKNLTTNKFGGHHKLSAEYIRKKVYKMVPSVCHCCTFRHCHNVVVQRGPQKGLVGEEVEYEILAGFGPNWGISDPGTITMLNKVNDDLGMDAKETSFLISMIMEAREKKLLSVHDLDGVDIRWGNGKSVVKMLNKIARREGIGDSLAEGVMRSSQRLGESFKDIAVYVKRGNAPHVHDCRTRWGTLFNQVVSDMGSIEGIDLTARSLTELGIEQPTKEPDEYLGRVNAITSWWRQFQESLIYCYYQTPSAQTMIDTFNSLTGSEYCIEDSLKIGRRIVNLLRMYNHREGMTRNDDMFSPRLGRAPVDGPGKGKSIAPTFNKILNAYYEASGWGKNGMPTRKTLQELGLGFTLRSH